MHLPPDSTGLAGRLQRAPPLRAVSSARRAGGDGCGRRRLAGPGGRAELFPRQVGKDKSRGKARDGRRRRAQQLGGSGWGGVGCCEQSSYSLCIACAGLSNAREAWSLEGVLRPSFLGEYSKGEKQMRWHRCLCVEERDSGVVGVGSGGGVCGRISSVSCGASRRHAHDSDKIRTREAYRHEKFSIASPVRFRRKHLVSVAAHCPAGRSAGTRASS